MLKFVFAAVLAVVAVWVGSSLAGVLPGDLLSYGIAFVVALLCVGMTTRVSQTNWLTLIVLLGVGAVLFWGLHYSLGAYLMVAGVGVLVGIIAVMLPAPSGSAAPASGGR